MLGAVPVAGEYAEDNRLLDERRIDRIGEASKKRRFTRPPGAAPHLEPPPLGIIHQEQKRTLVFGEIANADVLFVTCVFGKGNGACIEHFQETPRPSAMLDVGLAVGARSRKIGGVTFANKGD